MECSAGCTAEWRARGAARAGWGTRRGPLNGFPGRCSRDIETVPTAGFQCSRGLRPGSLTTSFALCPSLNVDEVLPPRNIAFVSTGSAPSFTFRGQSHLLLLDLEAVPGQISHAPLLAHNTLPARWTLIALHGLCPCCKCPPVHVCQSPWAYISAQVQTHFCYIGLSLEEELWK